jgi:hypothetical protein
MTCFRTDSSAPATYVVTLPLASSTVVVTVFSTVEELPAVSSVQVCPPLTVVTTLPRSDRKPTFWSMKEMSVIIGGTMVPDNPVSRRTQLLPPSVVL